MTEHIPPRRAPFRSLEFFTSADTAVFAGREAEIEEVATRILAGDTLVVYGPSGVGKTSLLCAGVVPALEKQRGYRATYVRPLRSPRGDVWRAVGADPAEALAAAIARLPEPSLPEAEPLDIDPAVGPVNAEHSRVSVADAGTAQQPGARRAPHVLVLDQIEELFTRFDEVQRRPLWDGLVEAIDDPRAPVRLVLALREEYLHLLDSAHPRLSNLLDRRFRLRGLAPFGARTAIVRPLVAGGLRYAPELIDRCVTDLTEVPPGHPDEDGVVDPLLLQIVCSEVYRRAELRDSETPSLTLADYTASGGPSGVFRRHLNELFSRVEVGDHLLLALVLQEMTTAHATKRPATVSLLSQSGLLATGQEIQSLLDKLVSANLVRRYEDDKEPWYELVHDRLVKSLPEQFARDQQFLRIRFMREVVRQLSKGLSEGVASATLLSWEQLDDLVEPFRKYIRFNDMELNLLFRSAIATEHEVVAWRDAYEATVPAGTPAVLLDMLGRRETRRSAALAVGVLRVADPAVRAECMRLALHDSSPHVEEAATRSLKAVAGDEEVAEMQLALKDKPLRPRALRVLGELTHHTGFRAKIEAGALRKAKRRHERARLLAAKETIRLRGGEGLLEGGRMGGLAGLIAALFLWCIGLAWFGVNLGFASYAWGIIVASAAIGAISGRGAGRAMAKRRALDRPPSWTRATLGRSTLVGFVGFVAVPSVVITFGVFAVSGASVAVAIVGLLAIVALGVPVGAVPIAVIAVGVTERVLAGVPWHGARPRTRAWVFASALSLSWLLAIAVGYSLVIFTNIEAKIAIATVYLGGAYGSVFSIAIASVFAEADRHLPRPAGALRPAPRRFLGLAPVVAFLAIIATLLRGTPLPFWAPVLDVTRALDTPPEAAPRPDSSASWADGRWVRIRNDSQEVHVLLIAPKKELLLAWPGTYPKWFPIPLATIEVRQPYRFIDLARDAEPDTYAVVQLQPVESDGTEKWQATLTLGPHLRGRSLGCRMYTTSDASMCSGNIGAIGSCELNNADLSDEGDLAPSSTVMKLSCPSPTASDAPMKQIKMAEAIVLFQAAPDSHASEQGQEPIQQSTPSPDPAAPAPSP